MKIGRLVPPHPESVCNPLTLVLIPSVDSGSLRRSLPGYAREYMLDMMHEVRGGITVTGF